MLDEKNISKEGNSRNVKVLGTLFLLFQILFAVNNYGPQHIPGLSLIFDEPWVAASTVTGFGDGNLQSGQIQFEDLTGRSGLDRFRRAGVNSSNPNYLEVMGGGVAVADVTDNGFEDIFLISMPSFDDQDTEKYPSTLFGNNGDETFTDITGESGLEDIKGYPQGALFFDFDNDGWQDLYVAAYDGGQLFRNDEGVFTDITLKSGLGLDGQCGKYPCFASSAAAADYNRDGNLDLLIVNNVDWDINDPAHYGERRLFPAFFNSQPSILFRNNGDGTFTNVSKESGIMNEGGKGLSAVWFDFTGNGWPDLYFANDLSRNRLYINNGDGTFREMAAGARVNEVKSSMGVTAGDYNNDGRYDLLTTNLEGTGISLFRNTGDSQFDYASNYTGLNPSLRSSGWGAELVDINQNGTSDLVMASGPVWDLNPTDAENLFFENRGDGTFADVTASAGPFDNQSVSRGLAVLDVENNGKPDLIINNIDGGKPQLLVNRTETNHNWLKVNLAGTLSNRDAVGARVTVIRSDGLKIVQEVKAGNSYQSTGTKSLFFGLKNSGAEEITIHWPSGYEQTVRNPESNQIITITEEEREIVNFIP